MKVFKFGGASLKDPAGVRNVSAVLAQYPQDEILIVISAMGKMTNALEQVVEKHHRGEDYRHELSAIRQFHQDMVQALFSHRDHSIWAEVAMLFEQLELQLHNPNRLPYNAFYDRIVPYGELLSTKIVSAYLQEIGLRNTWLDARRLIRTDQNHRFARVNWAYTRRLVQERIKPGQCYLIQGFIGSDDDLQATTLGREGSDYTASILGYLLEAEEVIIWKDVPGVLNGDPKVFDEVALLRQISYREAIELAYYGASVIHPKTIQPLQEKGVPLRVKSFYHPAQTGTCISAGATLEPLMPCFIKKTEQLLLTLRTRDLAFIVEEHLSKVYQIFHRYGVRVNLTQNTAISSAFCINYDPVLWPDLQDALQEDFELSAQKEVNLYTVRHHDKAARQKIRKAGDVLLEQRSSLTFQAVIAAAHSSQSA